MPFTLTIAAQIGTILIATCSVMAMICACAHVKLDKRIKEIDLFGRALVVKQFAPNDTEPI
jgi:predicted hydrolase (HD superfamily)